MVHTASVIPAAMPGVTVATAWAIQQSDFTETLEANCLLPGPISREGISALRHTYCRTPSPDDRAKRRTPCVFIHAIEGHHQFSRSCCHCTDYVTHSAGMANGTRVRHWFQD